MDSNQLQNLYDSLSSFLIKNGFSRRHINTTLFTKTSQFDILIVQVYVGDILFSLTNKKMCKDFLDLAQNEFETSMIRELRYLFLDWKSSNFLVVF